MPYFSTHYSNIIYPLADGTAAGLYTAQVGAIHSIASHFTLSDRAALVTMPTGSGKTAVLMMTPYILKAERVLIITPGRMVREQIVHDFSGLVTLLKAGVLPMSVPAPKVLELKHKIGDLAAWNDLRQFDVVVSTPNCVSPGHAGIPVPPQDLFDLVLIDEAHHSAARTWAVLIATLGSARCVMFTATPFRKDDGEIPAKFVYSYPVARAYADGIFGKIRYVAAVPSPDGESEDEAVAKKAEEVLAEDRAAGLKHSLMVRTDRVTRAIELLSLYHGKTKLRLELVEGKTSSARVTAILEKLEAGELDGVVCVNMLGEGFNFPRLKIAAIHKPHKSLEVTLQFIGRFARTNANDIGEAKFIATQSAIDIEGERLFDEGAVWQDIVENLSALRIDEETHTREELERFDDPEPIDEDLSDLSLYALHPRSHVKILDVENVPVDLGAPIRLPSKYEVRYQNTTADDDALIVVLRVTETPDWASTDQILDRVHLLLVVYYLESSQLLFVNASDAIDSIYDAVVDAVAPEAKRISTGEIRRVVRNIKNQKIFNLGLRNLQAANTAESYRIIAGSDTQAKISPSDARTYGQGHVFMSGQDGDDKITIGYSSGGKVWAAAQGRIPALLAWCKILGEKIRTAGAVVTNSNLDSLASAEVVSELPQYIVSAQWHEDAFRVDGPIAIRYVGTDGVTRRCLLIDLDLRIESKTPDSIHLLAEGDHLSYGIDFSLAESETDGFFTATNGDPDRITVTDGFHDETLLDFVNRYYLSFGIADGGLLIGNELLKPSESAIPIDLDQLEVVDWTGIDIKSELNATAIGGSVHDGMRNRLAGSAEDVVFCDHGTGEVADFVSLRRVADRMTLTLWHCKGSSEPTPGARVEDAYEVCGQSQKSVAWRDIDRIQNRILPRLEKIEFVRGNATALKEMLEAAKNLRHSFAVVVVQPGISKGGLSPAIAELLGATNDHVLSAGFKPLRLLVSA